MNDYDDSEDYTSTSSFRARSNTWPLPRLDFAVTNGVCIDEPLPEIELEDDDLFTTNENWTTGLVDNDIMSWDPILNAQNQQRQQSNQQSQQPQQTVYQHGQQLPHQQQQQPHLHPSSQHHSNPPQQLQHHHHHTQAPQQQLRQPQQQHQQTVQPQHHHHQPQASQQSIQTEVIQQPHPQHYNQQQHQGRQQIQHHHHHHQQQQQPHHQSQQQTPQPQPQPQQAQSHQPIGTIHISHSGSSLMMGAQQTQQIPPHQHHHHQHHHQTTLHDSYCLDSDDPNEYHIQKLHHLHLDNNHTHDNQTDYQLSQLSSICLQGTQQTLSLDGYVPNTTPTTPDQSQHHHHHHQQLKQLIPAGYEPEPRSDSGLKIHDDELHAHPHLYQMTSPSLGHHSTSPQMLSSSLSTSGIGLSGDLEDLDYKPIDSSAILNQTDFDNPLNETQEQPNETAGNSNNGQQDKQTNSTNSSKTKLNTPRRNAWGNMSYADLISQAINSTNDKRLTLSQIYDWMVQHVPYFKDKGDSNSSAGWKNSVRHNLSLHSRFKRLQNEGTGKSSWWTINPEANVNKCARRRAASMEASKYEKKRGRAKKRAEAMRQGLTSYPSLTSSSLNGSTTTLEQTTALHQASSQQFCDQVQGTQHQSNPIQNGFYV